jgi:hypothetical protein
LGHRPVVYIDIDSRRASEQKGRGNTLRLWCVLEDALFRQVTVNAIASS